MLGRLFTTHHKAIGKRFLFLSLFSVLAGVTLSVLMRFHYIYPNAKVGLFEKLWPAGAAGGVMTPELYLSLVTMHGTLMVFFVLSVAPLNGFGNVILPLQLGAREMAFPRLNALSFWVTALALAILLAAFAVEGGPPLSGWTAYPPLSAIGAVAGPGQGLGQTLWILALAVFAIGQLLGAINFIATTLDLRAPGMTLMRMPLTAWAWFVTSILVLLAFSVLLAAGLLLLMDRLAGTSFFVPSGLLVNDRLLPYQGGSPLLWQHLFWFFGHPEVYIAILPGMGLVSTLLSVFSRKPVFGYKAMVWSMAAIGFLGFVVWGHHMFASGMSPYSSIAFSLLTMAIGVPSAVETFNWLATIWGGQIRTTTAMLFALGFLSLFVSGGVSGIFLGQPALDVYFHDTYFVVGHFHLIMGVAANFTVFAGLYYWFPILFGRMMNERLGRVHFYLTFLGVHAIFVPMHFLGMAGNPRRYADYTEFEFLGQLVPVHTFISHAAFFNAAVQLIFVANFFWSLWKGAHAPANPWQATTLEWTDTPAPVVRRGPCDYSVPGAPKDFLLQTEP